MRHRGTAAILLAAVTLAPLAIGAERLDMVNYIESNPTNGSSGAVLVGDVPIRYTPQLLSVDEAGKLVAPGDVAAQAEAVLDEVTAALDPHGGSLPLLLKLNVYVTRDEHAADVRRVLATRFATEARPAVAFVTTRLPQSEALVAMDGVGAVEGGPRAGGAWLYISGQAEPGELLEATRKTLISLSRTLKYHDLSDGDVVQLKCFMHPIDRAGEVQRAIDEHFGRPLPVPVSFVEWQSSLPIEIELVAAAGAPRPEGEPVEYLPAPDLGNSPLYSRVVRVNRGPFIFFSGIDGAARVSPGEEVDSAFRELARLLEKTGGDLEHLVKATYYVTDDAVSKVHNEVRPRYYRPDRPPAASKALVTGTGRTESRYTMDMIAVPASRGMPASGPERGHGLTPEEALAGWISLFDGQSTFGWREARVERGRLLGGMCASRLGACELRAELDGLGALRIGDREFPASEGKVATTYAGPCATLEILPGSQVVSLAVRPQGLSPLFNGRDLDGWRRIDRSSSADSRPRWEVEGGVLRAIGGPGALEYTDRQFGDMVVQLVVRTRSVHSNGGLFFRAIPGDFMNGYEAQLHNRCVEDDPAQPSRWATGGIDDRQNARRLASRDFVPFRMTVIAEGPHIATWINGAQMVDWTDERPAHENPREGLRLHPGVLQLQAHDPATDYELYELSAAECE